MTRAIVLGGGGPVGIAWESGLINGLADGGIDARDADFLTGTSAGSFVAARLAMGQDPRQFAAAFANPEPRANSSPRTSNERPADLSGLMALMADAQSGKKEPGEAMRALGKYALEAKTMSEEDFIASFGSFLRDLPDDLWPQKNYACSGVDVESGEFKYWTKESKVGLKRAVAGCCAVPGVYPPVTINGRRYMDGGMRSSINADLATGYDKVLVVVVRGDAPGPQGEAMVKRREAEFDVLRKSGATVHMIAPDEAGIAAMGANLMDFRKRGPAAAAGLAQGRAQAAELAKFWN